MPLALRISHGIMAALFAFSATLQFNDPDPAPWIVLYAVAAIVTGFAAAGRATGWFAPLIIVICVWWEIHYIRLGAWHTPFSDLTQEWHMTNKSIVDGREFYALIWITVWMGLILLRRPPKVAPEPEKD